MQILQYKNLDYSKVEPQYRKVVAMIENDDFYSADVKKIANAPYYRAKLDYTNRLLFKIVVHDNKKYALMLEIIHNHDYASSRFLNGAKVDESQILQITDPENLSQESIEPIVYVNNKINTFNVLDKIISYDDIQYEVFQLHFPLIVIGSAGSGKTVLTLEKMKECYGDILYITHSPFLVENSRSLYYSSQYSNNKQNIDFLSYRELLETIKVPGGNEVNSKIFTKWLARQEKSKELNDPNKLYEEFKGVISGSIINKAHLSRDEYIDLGIRQSIFHPEERSLVYELFEKYIDFLSAENLYDTNLISFEYLDFLQSKDSKKLRYDFVVVDEIQDFANIQLYLILKTLKTANKNKFIF